MKLKKRIKKYYKEAVKQHRLAKKAYRKAKTKGVKEKKLKKLWKVWQQAKYRKKARKKLLKWWTQKNKLAKAQQSAEPKAKSDKPDSQRAKPTKSKSKTNVPLVKENTLSSKPVKTTLIKRNKRSKVVVPAASKQPRKPTNSKQDLKKIEGIGPKIEQILNASGIHNWQTLSKTPIARLNQILAEAGPRFRMHRPDSWGQQALLAAQEKWEQLKRLQDRLKRKK